MKLNVYYVKNMQIVERGPNFPEAVYYYTTYSYTAVHIKDNLYFYYDCAFYSYCIVEAQRTNIECYYAPEDIRLQYEKYLNDKFDKRINEILDE